MKPALTVAFGLILGCAVDPEASAQTPGRVAITCDGSQLTLSWDCVSGKQYVLLSTADLGNTWQEVVTQPNPLVAGSNRLSYTLSLTLETQFYRVAEVVEATPTGMVWIPPGTFTMGSPPDEVDRGVWEEPQTTVIISRGFWMGKYEVTQGEYLAVMGGNPSHNTGGTNLPVEMVTWIEAADYCAKLTEQERVGGRIRSNYAYQLPTEAEWEYACRAGTTTRFSYGDDPGYMDLTNYAWYYDNSGGETHPVGQLLANPWGLYDMHGNVSEWCQDWWSYTLPGGIALDPQGPTTGSERVIRGGSQAYPGWRCRSAIRRSLWPELWSDRYGFRIVLAPGQR